MSRRPPSDTFTRFTSHNPQSAQNPTSFGYTSPQTASSAAGLRRPPAGDVETPQQKVARLRALAKAQKESQLSGVDKMVAGGRRWADVTHRAAAYTLLGLTGVHVDVSGRFPISELHDDCRLCCFLDFLVADR